MITMIDYGGSNLRSAQKAFEFAGGRVQVSDDPDLVRKADKLVLPGVGAFGAGINALRGRYLDQAALEAVKRGALLLGICLGMQFLLDESDEMGQHRGMGLIPGKATRFPKTVRPGEGDDQGEQILKVPHMGWNQIEHDQTHPLLAKVPSGCHTYFVHSYYCIPEHDADIIARTEYGIRFASIIGRDNVYGIQFHPEKSQQHGLDIIANYLAM